MLNALFAACGLLIGTLIVGGAAVGIIWLALESGGMYGAWIVALVVLGAIAD